MKIEPVRTVPFADNVGSFAVNPGSAPPMDALNPGRKSR